MKDAIAGCHSHLVRILLRESKIIEIKERNADDGSGIVVPVT
jgi:hypothetical protein